MSDRKGPAELEDGVSSGLPHPAAGAEQPRGNALPDLDLAIARGTAKFEAELRRMSEELSSRYTTQTLEAVELDSASLDSPPSLAPPQELGLSPVPRESAAPHSHDTDRGASSGEKEPDRRAIAAWSRPSRPRLLIAIVCALALGIALLLWFVLLGARVQGLSARAPTSRPALASAGVPRAATMSGAATIATRPPAARAAAAAPSPRLATPAPTAGAATAVPAAAPQTLAATAAPTAPTAADLLGRVAAAEQALRSGTIDVTLDYGSGSGASARIRFDMGDANLPRLQIQSTYTGEGRPRVVERLTIGEQSWERVSPGGWVARQAHEGIVDQISVYLPHADEVAGAELSAQGDAPVLRWYDPGRDADVTLMLDAATGAPRELRQVTRATGARLVVIYSLWNAPIEIDAPPAAS
jgi:hypothetical protein